MWYEKDNKRHTWDDWSEEEELRNKKIHDKFLQAELNSNEFHSDWGDIESVNDRRSGSAHIEIRYK
jgi:hypothetical protein